MNAELLRFHAQILNCRTPEDLFGVIDESALKLVYRRMARIAHADRYQRLDEQRLAHVTFVRLNDFYKQAQQRFADRLYGTAPAPALKSEVVSKRDTYTIYDGVSGDVSTVYRATNRKIERVYVKIAKPGCNDFVAHEAAILETLNHAAAGTVSYKQFIPTLLDTFQVHVAGDMRRVNVLNTSDGFRSLAEIRTTPLDTRHFVWMASRLFTTLSFTHGLGIVHGAVLPSHILIHPETHAIRLIDWCFAVHDGHPLKAMSTAYAAWYPEEVKQQASAATDIYMAARCLNELFVLRPPFSRLIQACKIKNPLRRPPSAWELYKTVQEMARHVYGPPQYVHLQLD